MVIHYTNINNKKQKRLSRLQRITLELLKTPPDPEFYDGYYSRKELALEVAKRYRNGSFITVEDKINHYVNKISQLKEKGDLIHNRMAELLEIIATEILNRRRQDQWLTNKFSVSLSRSLKNLKENGFVEIGLTPPLGTVGVRLTSKGRKFLDQRRY